MQNSYQQKRVMKQALKSVLEEDSELKEKLLSERRAKRALERDLMLREDQESAMASKQEEGYSEEFGTFEWARKVVDCGGCEV